MRTTSPVHDHPPRAPVSRIVWILTVVLALGLAAAPTAAAQETGKDFDVCESDLWVKWQSNGQTWEASDAWPDTPPQPTVEITTEGDDGPWAVHWESTTPVSAVGVKASTDVTVWPGGTSGDVTGWAEDKDGQVIEHAISFVVFCFDEQEAEEFELRIVKVDESEDPLAGATFAIGEDDNDNGALDEGEVDDTQTTGESGVLSWTFDAPFVGLIDELSPPDGYVGDALIAVTVDDYVDGVATFTVVNEAEEPPPPEPELATVTVTKVVTDPGEEWDGDDFGFELAVGASSETFTLGDDETSDTFEVAAGTVISLTETEDRDADDTDMTLAVDGAAATPYTAGEDVTVEADGVYHFEVTNTFEALPVVLPAQIGLVKTADPTSVVFTDGSPSSVTVTYTYTVTNLGEAELVDVAVFDETLDEQVVLGTTELASGASTSGTLELEVTAEDAGVIENVAVATAVTRDGRDVDDEATATVNVSAVQPSVLDRAEIDVVKVADVATIAYDAKDGDDEIVTYTYTVTNSGVATLVGVTLVDDVLGPITLSTTTLAEGEMVTATATYVVTAADAGTTLVNEATATGHTEDGRTVFATDDASVDVTEVKGIVIDKDDELPVTGLDPLALLAWAALAFTTGGVLLRRTA